MKTPLVAKKPPNFMNSRNNICFVIGKSNYKKSKKYEDIATALPDIQVFTTLAQNSAVPFKQIVISVDEDKNKIIEKMT